MGAKAQDFKGYATLLPEWQKQFETTFKRHQAAMGDEMKERLKPVSVRMMKEDGRNMLKVTYCDDESKRREWWPYLAGNWW